MKVPPGSSRRRRMYSPSSPVEKPGLEIAFFVGPGPAARHPAGGQGAKRLPGIVVTVVWVGRECLLDDAADGERDLRVQPVGRGEGPRFIRSLVGEGALAG